MSKYKMERRFKTCLNCDKSLPSGKKLFCSKKCSKEFKKLNRKGTEFDISY